MRQSSCVAELFPSKQLLELKLFESGHSLYKLNIEGVIQTVFRGSDEKIPDFADNFGREVGNDIIKMCLL